MGIYKNGGRRMNEIIEFMRGMTIDELGEQTWYWKGEEE